MKTNIKEDSNKDNFTTGGKTIGGMGFEDSENRGTMKDEDIKKMDFREVTNTKLQDVAEHLIEKHKLREER